MGRKLAEIGPSSSKSPRTEDIRESSDVESESDKDLPPTSLRFCNFREAIACLEDVCHFLEHKGHTREATETVSDTLTDYATLCEPLKS